MRIFLLRALCVEVGVGFNMACFKGDADRILVSGNVCLRCSAGCLNEGSHRFG